MERTLRWYWGLLPIAAAMMACTDDDAARSMQRHTIDHAGLEREYFVFLPSSYDEGGARPVVIFLHGYGGTATGTEAEVTQGLNFYAEQYGYVVVYPQSTWFMAAAGTKEQWEVTSWNHVSDGFDRGPEGPICTEDAAAYPCPPECGTCGKCGWASCHDDVGFLKSLVAEVRAKFDVDESRVFVSGFSNGAMMAQRLACEASDLFAAAALVGGRVEPGFECTPTRPLPLLQINGGRDRTIPVDGEASDAGYFYATPESVARHWADGAACVATSKNWSSTAIEGENVRCALRCGDTAHPSIDCLWSDGDHRWPGTQGVRGSDGYCVSDLQAASMPEQTRCLAPDPDADIWGSGLLFDYFSLIPDEWPLSSATSSRSNQ